MIAQNDLVLILYRILKQRRLRRACNNAQTCQSIRCSHSQNLDFDKDSDQILDLLPRFKRQYGHLNEAFAHMW